nr:hypothetical protein [Rhodoferax sp. TBRC 17660]
MLWPARAKVAGAAASTCCAMAVSESVRPQSITTQWWVADKACT